MTTVHRRQKSPAGVPLTQATLADLPACVSVPGYDRAALRPGVVHFGVGGFHRAHQAVYFDDLARRGRGDGWAVTGVGLRSPRMGEVLRAQDCLYLVVERGPRGSSARVVGSMRRYLYGPRQGADILDVLADPATRLVTLTLTGNGYQVAPDGTFLVDDPVVADELAHPDRPGTVFGHLVEALDRRRRAGLPPFTVLSCDNIPDNGGAARTMVVSFAELRDPALARWIDEQGAFPRSMVDRITPETTAAERDAIVRAFGVADRWPVVTEPFSQWVVEDRFSAGRPPLEEVGVQFVTDVGPYELSKKRLLNASHCALGYLGVLGGHRTTAGVMADPVFAAYAGGLLGEVVPLLPRVGGLDLDAYRASLLERLANPGIADDLARLCRRGSTKLPAYLLPSVREALAAGLPHPLLTLAVAGWFRYLADADPAGDLAGVEGLRTGEFVRLARENGSDPRPLLGVRDVFGDLGDHPAFVADLERAVDALRDGPHAAIRAGLSR